MLASAIPLLRQQVASCGLLARGFLLPPHRERGRLPSPRLAHQLTCRLASCRIDSANSSRPRRKREHRLSAGVSSLVPVVFYLNALGVARGGKMLSDRRSSSADSSFVSWRVAAGSAAWALSLTIGPHSPSLPLYCSSRLLRAIHSGHLQCNTTAAKASRSNRERTEPTRGPSASAPRYE